MDANAFAISTPVHRHFTQVALVAVVVTAWTVFYMFHLYAADHPAPAAPHAVQSWQESIAQGVTVVILTFLAFQANLLPYKASQEQPRDVDLTRSVFGRIEGRLLGDGKLSVFLLFLIPAGVFCLAMINRYQAAVFVMAMVAIFVSAEHYIGLSEQKDRLETQRRLLQRQEQVALDQALVLERQEVLLTAYNREIGNLRKHVRSLANAFGLEKGRQEIYEAYSRSSGRIRAVVKHFDIDRVWWNIQGKDAWAAYVASRRSSTLYASLSKSACRDIVFVSDMGLPVILNGDPEQVEHVDDERMAAQFNNLVGMAWQCVVLAKVHGALGHDKVVDYQIRVASVSSWMHVADNSVYQVIDGDTPAEAKVRDLTLDTQKDLRRRLVDWAESEIEHAAERGCTAQEYLCAVLWRTIHKLSSTVPVVVDGVLVKRSLDRLGLASWIKRKSEYISQPPREDGAIEKLCCAIFVEFLTILKADDRKTVRMSRRLANLMATQTSGTPPGVCYDLDLAYEAL